MINKVKKTPEKSSGREIVRCAACGNYEYLSNGYCRICGAKQADAKRDAVLSAAAAASQAGAYVLANAAIVALAVYGYLADILLFIPLGGFFLFIVNFQIHKRLDSAKIIESMVRRAAYETPLLKECSFSKPYQIGHVALPASLSYEELYGELSTNRVNVTKTIDEAQLSYRLSVMMMIVNRNVCLSLELAERDGGKIDVLLEEIASVRRFYREYEFLIRKMIGAERYSAINCSLDDMQANLRLIIKQNRILTMVSFFRALNDALTERQDLQDANRELKALLG